MNSTPNTSSFFIVSLVFSLLGALMVFLADFGGWLEYDSYYGDLDYYAYIGSEIAPVWLQFMLVIIGLGLLSVTYLSYKGMRNELSSSMLNTAYFISFAVLLLTIFETVSFLIYVSDAEDWWLDIGFYGALIGSAIPTYFLYQARQESLLR